MQFTSSSSEYQLSNLNLTLGRSRGNTMYCISVKGHSWWGEEWEVLDKECQMWQCILIYIVSPPLRDSAQKERVLLINGNFSKTDSS